MSRALVVLETEIVDPKQPNVLWAWCLVADGMPGFYSMSFTKPDGVTVVDAPDPTPRLGRHLFTVPLGDEGDQGDG
jgi:hypothetical protein